MNLSDCGFEAFIGDLLGPSLRSGLKSPRLLQLRHICLITEKNHFVEVRLRLLNFIHVEAKLVQFML